MKSDVYSFGIVLLEILTGRKAFDMNLPAEDRNLATWVESRLRKEHVISDIMDADIKGQYTDRAALKASTLARKCTSRHPKSRPTAKQVVEELERLLALFQQLQRAEIAKRNNRLISLSTRRLCCRFSLDEMLQATSNFYDELVIGKGGFGYVYKGTLAVRDTPTAVAIKRLKSMSKQGSKEFLAEIQMLTKLRHSHLVSLIGYCDEGYEMILVYEIMPGGTLADHLYKRVKLGDSSLPPLSWVQRLKICIGAARGLDYLHTGTGIQNRIIHLDVKTTNILLDENYAAKISDFGLSKTSPANQATTYVSTHVKGTMGYLDPYYCQTLRLTWRSDVYSFGVVLFEVLCGRPALDRTLEEEQKGLVGWAQHCFDKDIFGQIIDPRMKEEASPDSLEVLVKVAIQCIDIRPKHRPTMAEVVVGLESALASQEKST